jgi:hypothetical protein
MKEVRLRRPSSPFLVRLATGLLVAAVAAVAAPLAAPLLPSSPSQAFDPCDVNDAERLVAVGDVHGAYDQFVAILRAAEITDADGHWAGGHTHFVQLGDVVDRGPDSRKALDLLMRLEREAEKEGGRVYPLLGNHEVGAMLGDVRYASPAEYAAFQTADSENVRERYYERLLTEKRQQALAAGKSLNESALRAEFLNKTPLGFVERQVAFGPTGEYGKWLRQHNAVVRINQIVFVHGGISPSASQLGCKAINDKVRADLTKDIEKTLAAPLNTLVASPDGPLWYRGLAQLDESAFGPQVDSILARLKARAIVDGHTVMAGGHITLRFHGKVFLIDTGMLSSVYAGGRASALEFKDDIATAIYVDGRERLTFGSAAKPDLAAQGI